jgi:hypothetical protein
MLRNRFPLLAAATLLQASILVAQSTLTPLAGFGTNGWLAPGSTPYLTTGNTERGMSYNPFTGNLVLVARQNVGGISNNVRILSGATGADVGGLDNTGFAGGTFLVNLVDVGDDGAIYACNLATTAASAFKVYKWDSEATGFTTPATVAYNAVAGVARIGDAFAVTGGLLSPAQFAGAGSNNVSASNFVVGSLDGLNTSTAYLSVPGTTVASNDYRLGLTFVDQDTLVGNQGATARLTSFSAGTSTLDASIALGGAARRALDYAVIGGRNLLAVIDSNSSQVTVFDITVPSAPVVLAQANNTTGTPNGNTNGSGAVAWGAISGNTATLYAMATNNGLQAFQFTLAPAATAVTYGTGCDGLTIGTNGVPTIGNAGFEIAVGNVPLVSPVAFIAFGSTVVNPGIDLTLIGMAGCFSYTSFDLGLFGTNPLVGSTGTYPLPIPNNAALAGSSLAAQGVSLSLLTSLALASSNGLQFTLGF